MYSPIENISGFKRLTRQSPIKEKKSPLDNEDDIEIPSTPPDQIRPSSTINTITPAKELKSDQKIDKPKEIKIIPKIVTSPTLNPVPPLEKEINAKKRKIEDIQEIQKINISDAEQDALHLIHPKKGNKQRFLKHEKILVAIFFQWKSPDSKHYFYLLKI